MGNKPKRIVSISPNEKAAGASMPRGTAVRCDSCKQWHADERTVSTAYCAGCSRTFYRCSDKDCGGLNGALRSFRAHFAWHQHRGHEQGGHNANHRRDFTRWLELNWSKTGKPKLKFVKGGKR